MLAQIGLPDAVPPLIGLLDDDDGPLLGTVATALGDLRNLDALKPQSDLARSPSGPRLPALTALGKLEAWQEIDLLLEALDDPAPSHFARRGLEEIAGEDSGDAAPAWRAWWQAHRTLPQPSPPASPEILEFKLPGAQGELALGLVAIPPGQFVRGGGHHETAFRGGASTPLF